MRNHPMLQMFPHPACPDDCKASWQPCHLLAAGYIEDLTRQGRSERALLPLEYQNVCMPAEQIKS